MASDSEEFMDLAKTTFKPPPDPQAPTTMSGLINDLATEAKAQESQRLPGGKVQYQEFADGFAPAGQTVPSLPPGTYRIQVTPQGAYFSPQRIVTDNLLRLPDAKSDEVIREIERFWTLKSRFTKFGFTHKRGFLLWGPPGSGKTSTVALVSKQLVEAGGVVVIGNCHPVLLSSMLSDFRQVEPQRPLVVLLEDLDTIISQHGEHETLALLDGESSVDNVVFVATTNYPEHLDGRVVNRPSRFDRVVKIGMPSPAARKLYIESRGVPGDVRRWVDLTEGFSLAHIKELIIGVCCFEGDLDAEADRLRGMSKKPKSDAADAPVGFGAGR